MESLSRRPADQLLARAADLRAMASTARDMATTTALVRLAERFEVLAAQRLGLPDDPAGA